MRRWHRSKVTLQERSWRMEPGSLNMKSCVLSAHKRQQEKKKKKTSFCRNCEKRNGGKTRAVLMVCTDSKNVSAEQMWVKDTCCVTKPRRRAHAYSRASDWIGRKMCFYSIFSSLLRAAVWHWHPKTPSVCVFWKPCLQEQQACWRKRRLSPVSPWRPSDRAGQKGEGGAEGGVKTSIGENKRGDNYSE